MKKERLLGVHVSISGGMYRAIERGMELGINAMQVFLKNSNQWEAKPYTEDDIQRFTSLRAGSGVQKIFAHAGYLINLAGSGEMLEKSVKAMADEMKRAALLDIEYIVIHPGNHMGAGESEGIKGIAESLDRSFSLSGTRGVKLLLETTAGQGTSVGHRFGHLAEIMELSENRESLDICLDTCHVFASGYDISVEKEYRKVMSQFDSILGLKRLKLIHLNDSKKGAGSRVDRHEHIGMGLMGDRGLIFILNDPKLRSVPLILETPKTDDASDAMNLARVRKLMK